MKFIYLWLLFVPASLFAQRDFSSVEVKPNKVTDNIQYLIGSGGNIGVLHGPDGVMIIDDQFAPLSEKIKAAISQFSDADLKFVVNTHYHGDHTGGNENFKKKEP